MRNQVDLFRATPLLCDEHALQCREGVRHAHCRVATLLALELELPWLEVRGEEATVAQEVVGLGSGSGSARRGCPQPRGAGRTLSRCCGLGGSRGKVGRAASRALPRISCWCTRTTTAGLRLRCLQPWQSRRAEAFSTSSSHRSITPAAAAGVAAEFGALGSDTAAIPVSTRDAFKVISPSALRLLPERQSAGLPPEAAASRRSCYILCHSSSCSSCCASSDASGRSRVNSRNDSTCTREYPQLR
jgi:hypothetical protein